MPDYSELTRSIGYNFKSIKLLALAMTHPSFGANNNQRLEFLGDSVLELCVSQRLYSDHTNMKEGQLTALRATLVCEDTLYMMAERLELDRYIRMTPPLRSDTRGRKSVMADAVEALLAAVYIDGGFDSATQVVEALWADEFDGMPAIQNSKSDLQEYLQGRHLSEPQYETVEEDGPAHKRRFTVAVSLDGKELARAQGNSKKDAQQQAAAQEFEILIRQGEGV